MGEYFPVVLVAALAAIICAVMVTLSYVLGPKKDTSFKASPYECGVTPMGDAQKRFPIKFYLVGILFVLFDIEVVFLWSWLTVFRNESVEYQLFSGAAVAIYMALWILGDAYVLKVGAIDWDEATAIPEEKYQSSQPLATVGEPAPVAQAEVVR